MESSVFRITSITTIANLANFNCAEPVFICDRVSLTKRCASITISAVMLQGFVQILSQITLSAGMMDTTIGDRSMDSGSKLIGLIPNAWQTTLSQAIMEELAQLECKVGTVRIVVLVFA